MKDKNMIVEKDSLGNEYKTVIINNQQWTADNLSVNCFRNGDPIPECLPEVIQSWNVDSVRGLGPDAWASHFNEKKPCFTYLKSDPENNKHLGKLYNFHVVNDIRGVGPEGFRIPTAADFQKLADFAGTEAGKLLKSKNSTDLNLKSINWASCAGTKKGNNKLGFNGVPSGLGMIFPDQQYGMAFSVNNAVFWTTDLNHLDFSGKTMDQETPCVAELHYGHDDLIVGKLRVYTPVKSCAMSIRMVKDI